MRSRIVAFCLASVAALAFGITPAHAHSYIVIAGFQVTPGGYVSTPAGPQSTQVPGVTDGTPLSSPATDGTEVWTNLDPVEHSFHGTCVARPTSGSLRCAIGQAFSFTITAGGQKVICGLPLGTYHYSETSATFTWMTAEFRVTSQGTDEGCDNGLPIDWPAAG